MKLNIGDNIRQYRKRANLTQEQLADTLGVSYQSVSRWENCSTYPDMELLPSIAKAFNVSIDELLGMPEEKKEQEAEGIFTKLAKASFEKPVNTEKVIELIRDIRRNYVDCKVLWHFWLSVNKNVYRMPEILPEVRLTAEKILDGNADVWTKNEIIALMAKIEDDMHIDKFMERYASQRDLTKNVLLRERYRTRGEWDKEEPLRQFFLFQHVDDLIGNSKIMWRDYRKAPDLHKSIAVNNLELNLLHQLCAQVPDKKHPISGNGEVDFWVEHRMWMGFRKACYLASSGDPENAFLVLEDTVSLLEKAVQITSPIELCCSSPWLDLTVWTAEESWNDSTGFSLIHDEEERCIWIHNKDYCCSVLYPSWYRDILSVRKGWEWFDPIRDDPRYKKYVDRLSALVVTRPKKAHNPG